MPIVSTIGRTFVENSSKIRRNPSNRLLIRVQESGQRQLPPINTYSNHDSQMQCPLDVFSTDTLKINAGDPRQRLSKHLVTHTWLHIAATKYLVPGMTSTCYKYARDSTNRRRIVDKFPTNLRRIVDEYSTNCRRILGATTNFRRIFNEVVGIRQIHDKSKHLVEIRERFDE